MPRRRRKSAAGKSIYAEFDERVFFESCRIIVGFGEFPLLRYYAGEYERAESARADFERIFEIDGGRECDELNDEIEYVAGIQKNMDKISGWCRYREVAEKCRKKGFEFVLEPLALGDVAPDDVLACFKKRVYAEFVKSEVVEQEDGSCAVRMYLRDDVGSLMKLELTAPSKTQGRVLQRAFEQKA